MYVIDRFAWRQDNELYVPQLNSPCFPGLTTVHTHKFGRESIWADWQLRNNPAYYSPLQDISVVSIQQVHCGAWSHIGHRWKWCVLQQQFTPLSSYGSMEFPIVAVECCTRRCHTSMQNYSMKNCFTSVRKTIQQSSKWYSEDYHLCQFYCWSRMQNFGSLLCWMMLPFSYGGTKPGHIPLLSTDWHHAAFLSEQRDFEGSVIRKWRAWTPREGKWNIFRMDTFEKSTIFVKKLLWLSSEAGLYLVSTLLTPYLTVLSIQMKLYHHKF